MHEDSSPPSKENHREQAKAIVDEFLRTTESRDTSQDRRLIDAHPDLAPDLENQLRAARLLQPESDRVENPTSIGAANKSVATIDYRQQYRCPECHSHLNRENTFGESISCDSCGCEVSIQKNPTQLVPGASLGRFDLLEQVGAGAFGVVWRAFDPHLDRDVAIKVPRDARQTTAELELFLREGRAASQVRHKNIVAVYEVGRDGDTIYLVSDFIDGRPLSRLLAQDVSFSNREVAELAETICLALQAIHNEGVIHRDLKPENVLINKDGSPFLTDFGLAKKFDGEVSMTMDGQVMGTPAYMSPEQARGDARSADARSDIYSVGVMLFEMLTGERPFRGSPHRILEQVTSEDPPSLRTLQPTVDRDLDTICLRCMEKSPAKRFQSAAECAEELRRFLNGEPIVSRRIGSIRRAARWCRRKPFVASVVALVIAMAATSVYVAIRERQHREELQFAKNHSDQMAAIAKNRAQQAERNEQVAIRNAYSAQLISNQHIWDPFKTRILLDDESKCPKSLREFTWRHLMYASNRDERQLEQIHTEPITAIAFSPDQQTLASCGEDGRVVLWDTQSWKPTVLNKRGGLAGSIAKLRFAPNGRDVGLGDADNVYQLAFLPDGSGLLTTHHLGHIRLWNTESGKLIRTIVNVNRKVQKLAVTKDGKRIAFATDGGPLGTGSNFLPTLTICNLESPEQRLTLAGLDGFPNSIDFSPDGKWLASGGKGRTVQIWDSLSGACVNTRSYENNPVVVRFSPDGAFLFVGVKERTELLSTEDWQANDGFNAAIPYTRSATFIAGGRHIAAVDNGREVRALDAQTGISHSSFKEDSLGLGIVASSDDGRLLAVTLEDHSIKLIKLVGQSIFRVLRGHKQTVNQVCYSHDSRSLFTGSDDNTVVRWDAAHAFQIWKKDIGQRVLGLTASRDSSRVAASLIDGRIVVLDSHSGKILFEWQAHTELARGLSFLPNGQLVSSSWDGRIAIWKDDRLVSEIKESEYRFTDVAYDERRDILAVGTVEKMVRIYDVRNMTLRAELPHDGGVGAIDFSPSGDQLITASLGSCCVWDVESSEQRQRFTGQEFVGMGGVAFSSDGNTIATTEHSVGLWDPATGSKLSIFNEYSGSRAYSVDFAPDGNSLAYGRENGMVIIRQAIPAAQTNNE